jgi:hypothetical protein
VRLIVIATLGSKLMQLAPAVEIVSRIERGEWTATQVLEAYISRAAFAHAKTNCLTEGKFLNTVTDYGGLIPCMQLCWGLPGSAQRNWMRNSLSQRN